jgi:import inner membrane translocase subunit TIM16
MSNQLGRIIMQGLLSVGSVFAKAFAQSYAKVAAQRAAQASGQRMASSTNQSNQQQRQQQQQQQQKQSSSDSLFGAVRSKPMSVDEAHKILNLDPKTQTLSAKDVQERYLKQFTSNDVSKGGSFYVQSKIFRAKERLDKIYKPIKTNPTNSPTSSSS